MPNRILKDSICTSDNIDSLSAFHETFFYRLIVNCDDYGRLDARPKILSAKLYPLKNISEDVIMDALRVLTAAKLVSLYAVDGKPYLRIDTWERHQQVRAHKSKYPDPCNGIPIRVDDRGGYQVISNQMPEDDGNGNQMISDDIRCPRNPIQYDNEDEDARAREAASAPFISDEEAAELQKDQNELFDRMKDVGFEMNVAMMDEATRLLAEYGKGVMLDAVGECLGANGNKLRYLKKILRNRSSPAQPDEKIHWLV